MVSTLRKFFADFFKPVWSPDDILMNARIFHSMDPKVQKSWTINREGMLIKRIENDTHGL